LQLIIIIIIIIVIVIIIIYIIIITTDVDDLMCPQLHTAGSPFDVPTAAHCRVPI